MREILFKAKRIDNSEWVEGFFVNAIEECGNGERTAEIIKMNAERIYRGEYSYVETYVVDINTLCQYTGLTDKNGNKIWENDVVTHSYTTYKDDKSSYPPFRSEKKHKNYVIKFDSTASFLGYRYHNGRNIFPFKKGTVINGDDEVIGNIFDNPELLEV